MVAIYPARRVHVTVTEAFRIRVNVSEVIILSGGSTLAKGESVVFFFSSRRRHTRLQGDWSSDVCSSDLSWCTDPATALVTCLPLSNTGRTTIGNVADLNTYGGSASLTIKVNDNLTDRKSVV